MLKASVLIPTKNGEDYLEECLDMVFKQKTDFTFEVICVDSGSKDRTLEIMKKFPQIKPYRIPPEEFNHGTTRNLLASKANGEYLVYICQDVIPADENWLKNMIEPFEKDPQVAGAFGKQLSRKDCDPFQRRALTDFMNSFGLDTTVYQLKSPSQEERKKEFEANRHVLTFFSNANSALRKSVWQEMPFKKMDAGGEDQQWAKEVIMAGYKKVYEPKAAAYHSHNFGVWEQFKRWFDEYRQHKAVQNYIGVSSFWKIPLLTLRMWFNDIKYVYKQKEYNFLQKIYWAIWIFFIDLARFSAEYIGGRYEKLPTWLQNRFSREYGLINS